jgi:hypothetical protein
VLLLQQQQQQQQHGAAAAYNIAELLPLDKFLIFMSLAF